jgi:hypothetical protein
MAERAIFTAISNGLEAFTDKPALFERFLTDNLRLSATEAAKAKLYFEGGTSGSETIDARPPTLVHGYARTGGPFPCWAMTLGAETIEQDYLGKDAPFLDSDGENFYDPDTGQVVDPKVRRIQYRFDIMVISDHPDITVYYYHLLKYIIFSQQANLEEADVEDLGFTGQDMAPDPRYLPSDVFVRMLSLTVSADECWTAAIPGFTQNVGSIAIDDTGLGATEGDSASSVNAGITSYTTGS